MANVDIVARLGAGGRLVIPSAIRKAIGLNVGDEVVLMVDGEELRLLTSAQAIVRAQALLRKHVAAGRRLSDELVRQRRREAADE